MTDRVSTNEVLSISRALDEWAARTDAPQAKHVALEMTNTYTACSAVLSIIRELATGPRLGPVQTADLLVRLQTWLLEELPRHSKSLQGPLEALVHRNYQN